MASVKVFLAKNKQLKNGEYPVWIRIIIDRKTKYSSLGISTKLEWWDENKCIPNKKNPNKFELETLISKKIAEVKKAIMESEIENKSYSADEIIATTKKSKNKITVLKFYDEVIERFKKANKIGNAAVYRDSRKALFKFRKGKDLFFHELDPGMLNKLEEYLLGNDVSENSISVYIRTLRSLYNKAIIEGYVKKDCYPFDVYKISKLDTKTKKRAITKDLMQRIIDLKIDEDTNEWHSKNYFLFSYYNMGMNISDIAILKNANIENGRLKFKRMKTGKEYNIKLLKPAIEILNYYLEHQLSKYIFPILNDKVHINQNQIHNRIKKVTKQINSGLKVIAKSCDIDVKLTTYVARHSWATILKKSGVSTSVISEAMKHDTEKTTQIYLDSFENDIIDDANEKILG
ncbi:site-specific integrase [Cytophaga hutchinsonii]|uniref:Tn5520-like integrase (Transfer factor) n=1 Tax=Cytophaga hutchinsonii (strain ATCC 33406 / DSM 1761 / CIP 103989 / NBRC 15051 / NCIMB 9469 / D465) TaxID=269798 RepID=A0A6N4SQS5_CYTH3|nr:site-specific integrase [Cytophaga hutchinsonii]ABG58733.1 Tn5520-like integrase (transfer factor) [Cytophaga hutchinsonii ATCC 33406]SFX60661.1 Site-specific recombinase XerD [Cytophaga hutchinsonii ATCC 33406]